MMNATQILKGHKNHSKPPVSLVGQLYWREWFYTVGHVTPNFDKMEGNPISKQVIKLSPCLPFFKPDYMPSFLRHGIAQCYFYTFQLYRSYNHMGSAVYANALSAGWLEIVQIVIHSSYNIREAYHVAARIMTVEPLKLVVGNLVFWH